MYHFCSPRANPRRAQVSTTRVERTHHSWNRPTMVLTSTAIHASTKTTLHIDSSFVHGKMRCSKMMRLPFRRSDLSFLFLFQNKKKLLGGVQTRGRFNVCLAIRLPLAIICSSLLSQTASVGSVQTVHTLVRSLILLWNIANQQRQCKGGIHHCVSRKSACTRVVYSKGLMRTTVLPVLCWNFSSKTPEINFRFNRFGVGFDFDMK